ncbi:MAG: sulfite exporter TauE/SafE family protein [Hyphomonadaceae bacterium]|nr:sulfite exporter TauE/SafE family protein [Hyphomonadaceae bacterium]
MDPFFWQSVLVGFLAQLIDGALGMAYGIVSTSFLMAFGVPPAAASAAVHTAEMFTTGASGAAHIWRRNVRWDLVLRLAPAGIVGGVAGALTVSYLPVGIIKPIVSAYLLCMGVFVVFLALRGPGAPPEKPTKIKRLGLVGGFLDAAGGGGWGPIVTTTLLGRGHGARHTVGSVNTTEFLVTAAISASFFFALGEVRWTDIAGLLIGGVIAAPVAAFAVSAVRPRLLLGGIGCFVVSLAIWQIAVAIDPQMTFFTSLRATPG